VPGATLRGTKAQKWQSNHFVDLTTFYTLTKLDLFSKIASGRVEITAVERAMRHVAEI
jgi:hypothetical protein